MTKNLLKTIQSFLKSGEYKSSLKYEYVKESDSFLQWEQRKKEKKQKKGMGATSKNKIKAKNNSIPTPDNVKLVKTKLALKVKAAKVLELIS